MKKQKKYNPNDTRQGKCRTCGTIGQVISGTGRCDDCQEEIEYDNKNQNQKYNDDSDEDEN